MWCFSTGLAVAVALIALPAAAADDCDPEVEQALAASAESGANDALVLVTHPDHGIADPESIFDFGCVEGMFDFSHSNMLFDPGEAMSGILGLLERSICRAAQNAYRCYVGRGLDSSLFGLEAPRLGDLDFGVNCGTSRRGRGPGEGTRCAVGAREAVARGASTGTGEVASGGTAAVASHAGRGA